ncbi:sri-2 [Pristionchus pacificus]|uniref:Uncharacterized protein n=1 Tax=Pristionchus pacificus TaxID=54126 RepID=A0A2A6BDU4_PRIPA|nr:sri-2 [Pristionchus pacificus]|eukprot:PDM64049.1 hypothetical protein PRIPAC_54293 [Pristionchus pacificus]
MNVYSFANESPPIFLYLFLPRQSYFNPHYLLTVDSSASLRLRPFLVPPISLSFSISFISSMSSPISEKAEQLVTHTNYVTGPLYLIFNLSVLTWFYRNSCGYNDPHRNHYIVLLGILILTDSFWSIGAVILVRDKFIIYSPYSIFPSFMTATTCMCILFFLLITIGIVYFSMVLSRYQHLLPSTSSLRFDKWRLTSLNYLHLSMYFFIPIFYCAVEMSKDKKMEREYAVWVKKQSIYIIVELTPFLKAIIAGLALSITLLFSFIIKLYWRMHRSINLQKESTSVATRQLIFLPVLSFFIPAIALIIGSILSCINPDLSIICLLFHNTHSFFICLIIAIYGKRHHTSPTRMVTDVCRSLRKKEMDEVKLIPNPPNEVTKEQNM